MILKTITSKIISVLALALCVPLIASTCIAANYYVDRSHSNASDSNSGSVSAPWKTIQKGASVATGGDTVYVKAGVYNERVVVMNSGSKTNPITLQAYPGDKPIIDGTGVSISSYNGLFQISGKDYITVDGFEIRNSNALLFAFFSGTGGVLKNSTLHSNFSGGLNGVFFTDSNDCYIDNNEVYNTGYNGISITSSTNIKTRFNYLHDNPNHNGINIFPKTSETQTTYSGNDILYNRVTGSTSGIYTRYQDNNKIVGNVIYNNAATGIRLEYDLPRSFTFAAYTKIYNNTVVNNGTFGIKSANANNLTIKNNILSGNKSANLYFESGAITGHTINNNLYNGTFKIVFGGTTHTSLSSWQSKSNQDANSIESDPGFYNTSDRDFSLNSTSRAIDIGADLRSEGVSTDINGNPRPSGNGYDIGAYEFTDSAAAPPSPPKNLKIM